MTPPDSDVREVCECGFPKPPREGHFDLDNAGEFCWVGAPGSLATVHMGAPVEQVAPRSVRVSLSLAQRILAALEAEGHGFSFFTRMKIAAELRAHMVTK